MSKKLPNSINLLEPVFAPDDVWDKLYFWVFNVGKYIFVGVEVVVLIVFISRFLIDKKNNDLSRTINQRLDLLSEDFYKESEIKFQNLHSLLQDMRVSTEDQVLNSKVIGSVIDSLPSNLRLERFSFSDCQVSLTFTATEFASITAFERMLDENPSYTDVNVRLNQTGDVSSDIDFIVSYKINCSEQEDGGN